jgi:DNA-binding SARP family transcriptional activator
MHTLEVRLLGGISASLDGRSLGSFPTRWSAGLFAYLALNHGRPVPRSILATLFWPEETDQRALKGLRNALWRVRSQVEPPRIPASLFLSTNGRDICLNEQGVLVDVAEFEGHLAAVRKGPLTPARVESLEAGVALYRGHFLDGYDFGWSVFERERLRLALLASLELLLRYYMDRREWILAIQKGQAVLTQDPLRENVHRCLMACHNSMGNRPLAIRQYRECARILEEELGISPMEVTRELYRQIETGSARWTDALGLPDVALTQGLDWR